MKKELLLKTLALFIVVLFLIITVTPSIGISSYFDDTTPPITTISTKPEPVAGDWYPCNVEIILNATDNESGINVTYYKVNENGWMIYIQPFCLCECGINIFQFYSVDNAGNVEETKQVEINIDCYPPILNYTIDPPEPDGLNGWYVSNITITLNATDNESGVWYPPPGKTINITEDGENILVKLRVWDNVGNEASHQTLTFDLDHTKPTITMDYTWKGNPITGYIFTFTATATDDTSMMERVEFYFNDVLQKTVKEPGPTYQWTIKKTWIPNITIKAIAYDNAGNNGSGEIQDPHTRSIRQNLPFKKKINIGNFFQLGYFSYIILQSLILNLDKNYAKKYC